MEAEKIEVVKDWPEPKSVRDIQVFLGFANFYWRFIQGFSKIAAPLTSILKTTKSPDVSKPDVGNGDGEVVRFGFGGGGELAKKSGKLPKSGNSKGKKSAKSKKLLKSGNSPNFDAKKAGPNFLTPKARAAFNRLRLVFTAALILQHFDPECHIRIEMDASGSAISGVLSQLASGTSTDRVVTKVDLGQWHRVAFFSRKMIPVEI